MGHGTSSHDVTIALSGIYEVAGLFQSGHFNRAVECPLSGVKLTSFKNPYINLSVVDRTS